MKRISLANRLTFLFALASAAMLLGLGIAINYLLQRHFQELDAETLTGKLAFAQDTLAKVQSRDDWDTLQQQLNTALIGHPGLALSIRWPDGMGLVAASGDADAKALIARAAMRRTAVPQLVRNAEGRPYLRLAAAAPVGMPGAPAATVDVALDISHHHHFIAKFQYALWISVILVAILNGFLGRIAVLHGLAPLRAIRQQASVITAHRLHQRLPVEVVPVEMEELVHTLNHMLGRLEESFQRLSDFSSDLAHELRTPVSNMLTQTQVTLTKPRSADEYREILYSNAEEFTRLSRMIADMLFLAKAEHGLVAPFSDEVDLAAEVRDLFSFFEVVAEGKDVALRLDGAGSVTGDRMLLRRALSNILSNAIRHTHAAGRVQVAIARPDNGEIAIAIENTGDPIAPEHLPRLFDRFYRVDASRQESSEEGAGLGLAIARSILLLHGGSIAVQSGGGVTRFELLLPRSRKRG